MRSEASFRFSLVVLILMAMVLSGGCATGEGGTTHYYTLPYVGEFGGDRSAPGTDQSESQEAQTEEPQSQTLQGATAGNPALKSVRVLEVEVARLFDRKQLVERLSPTEVRYLSQDLWAASLPDSIGRLVYDGLTASQLAEAVYGSRSRREASHVVRTRVEAAELVRTGETDGLTHLEISMTLLDRSDSSVLVRHAESYRRELSGAEPGLFVESLAELLSIHVDAFSARIAEAER